MKINRNNEELHDNEFHIAHTDEYLLAAHELSGFIKTLPLSAEQNNQLVRLMVKQVTEAEKEAFVRGVELGRELAAK